MVGISERDEMAWIIGVATIMATVAPDQSQVHWKMEEENCWCHQLKAPAALKVILWLGLYSEKPIKLGGEKAHKNGPSH